LLLQAGMSGFQCGFVLGTIGRRRLGRVEQTTQFDGV
jgi:hypothetical protein